MKNDTRIIILYVLQGLPVPLSLVSWIWSLVSLVNLSTIESDLAATFALLTIFLAPAYAITYGVSLTGTLKRGKLNFHSFTPAIHFAVTALFAFLWEYTERLV